jgi:hypothetical protein
MKKKAIHFHNPIIQIETLKKMLLHTFCQSGEDVNESMYVYIYDIYICDIWYLYIHTYNTQLHIYIYFYQPKYLLNVYFVLLHKSVEVNPIENVCFLIAYPHTYIFICFRKYHIQNIAQFLFYIVSVNIFLL